MVQHLLVGVLVLGCGVYALWTLAPKGLRSRAAKRLLQWPLPRVLHAPLNAAARQKGGCGCDGCDKGGMAKSAQSAPRPMVFMPRKANDSPPRGRS